MSINDEADTIARNMKRYGGSFAQALSGAIMVADDLNLHKIKNTWNDMWEEYLNW